MAIMTVGGGFVLLVSVILLVKVVQRIYDMRRLNDSIYRYSLVNKLISFLGNPMAQRKLLSKMIRLFKLSGDADVTVGSKAPEVSVVGLDGFTTHRLIRDYSMSSPNIPLIVVISSYN